MQKIMLVAIITILMSGCASTKKTAKMLDAWLGSSKQQLILKWGPPAQTASDGANGEVLVYADRYYYTLPPSTVPLLYWQYKMMYVNGEGKIYHTLYKRNTTPPNEMDSKTVLY